MRVEQRAFSRSYHVLAANTNTWIRYSLVQGMYETNSIRPRIRKNGISIECSAISFFMASFIWYIEMITKLQVITIFHWELTALPSWMEIFLTAATAAVHVSWSWLCSNGKRWFNPPSWTICSWLESKGRTVKKTGYSKLITGSAGGMLF